jgi:hypothetical protein
MNDDLSNDRAALMERLGSIVILWTYVEQWLNELLTYLLEANPALMHTITVNVSSSTIADWVRTLLRAHSYPAQPEAEIMELLRSIDELRGERNALIHGAWTFDEPGTAVVQTIKLDRSPVVNELVVTLADLHELAIEIGEAKNALAALGQRFGFPPKVKRA